MIRTSINSNMFVVKHCPKKLNFSFLNRSFCNSVSLTDPNIPAESTTNEKHIQQIKSYLSLNDASDLLPKIPPKYLKKCKNNTRCILINPNVAKKIGKTLQSHIKAKNVLEFEPGLGLLSEQLIRHASHLRLYEDNPHFLANLKDVGRLKNSQVEFLKKDFIKINKKIFDVDDESLQNLIHSNTPSDDSAEVGIITISPSIINTKKWIHLLTKSQYFKKIENCQLFFIVPPSTYVKLIASPKNDFRFFYQAISILSQLAFDIELLSNNISREAFLPWVVKQKKKSRKIFELINDNEYLYLIKITPKKDFPSNYVDDDINFHFLNFVKHAIISGKRIIPHFENIIPGCGPKLILKGYTIYTKFTELMPEELVSLFLEFSNWPEFNRTTFFAHFENEMKNINSDELNSSSTLPILNSNFDEDSESISEVEFDDHQHILDEIEVDDALFPKT